MAELRGICATQRIVLYETKSRLYLVGSNNAETRFRVLKIDRTEPKDLVIIDDKVEYSQRQIKELLSMINAGNITRNKKGYDNTSRGLHRSMSAYGILGFVKFLEGYYIIVITERRKEAQIGGHTIYKIEDTQMIPIPNEVVRQKYQHPDEGRYVKIFQNVDLSSNFYFSYSYDLTLTLQQSLAPLLQPRTPPKTCSCNVVRVWNTQGSKSGCCHDSTATSSSAPNDVDSSDSKREPEVESLVSSTSSYLSAQSQQLGCESPRKETNFQFEQGQVREFVEDNSLPMNAVKTTMSEGSAPYLLDRKFGACQECEKNRTKDSTRGSRRNKVKACYKFVWNKYLLRNFEGVVHSDWVLHIINGFVGQSDICVYMRPIYVTVIARRSAEFAGTRFLKRGANDQGYVANEVETEQIVHDASVISLNSGRFTSYVQLRGSVPSFWSQDVNKGIVPKPQIMVDRADPYCLAASQHFNQLLQRYGAPVVILNLVKKKEKRRHEQILSEELQQIVEYLNQFLPPDLAIKYIGWDMSRTNKSKGLNVIQKLTGIADQVFKLTGFFHSGPELYCNKLRKDSRCEGMRGTGYRENMGRQQNGVLRVNCVDCLDRTNTAQFMAGKCALGFQLYTLGVIDKPIVRFDSDVVRILEDLYEAHGDTIALQYGGSQLVHGIRTYRKVSPFTSHSRDIMQTVSRYYSNAFNDADKQQAMNLFLGVFIPQDRKPRLWELPTDYYLHHNSTRDVKALKDATSYTKWCSPMVIKSLPHSVFEAREKVNDDVTEEQTSDSVGSDEESGDIFSEYYRPYELTKFDRLHAQVMQKSCRDFCPSNTTDPSPFVVRAPRKALSRRPVPVRKAVGAAPGMGADDSSDSDDSSDDESLMAQSTKKISDTCSTPVSFQDLLPSMKDIYGIGLREPRERSLDSYDRFVDFSRTAEQDPERKVAKHIVYNWKKNRPFSFDSCRQVKPPSVERRSRVLYGAYIQSIEYHTITADSLGSYRSYVFKQWRS